MPVISIIVPVYNVEKYIDKCIKSILAQTFKDFELILVDDGSTDDCGKICDEYAEKDKRIKVIHKKNGGLSSARNAGIEASNGSYLGFIDSDDYIDDDMYEVLYNNIIKENADISACGIYDCYYGKKIKKNKKIVYKTFITEEAIYSIFTDNMIRVSAWNKLYRKNIFDEIRYPVNKTAEDAFIIIDILLSCRKIVATSEQKYYYYHRENSIMTCRSARNCCDHIEAWEKNYDFTLSHFPGLANVSKDRLYFAYFFAFDTIINSYDKDEYIVQEKKILRYLRSNAADIIINSKLSLKRKAALAVLLLSKSAYRKLITVGRKIISPINS